MPLVSLYPSKGVNLLADPATLPEGQCAWAKNLYPHQQGILGKRYGAGEYIQLLTHTGEELVLAMTISPFPIGAYSFFTFLKFFDGSSCEVEFSDDAGNSGLISTLGTNPSRRPRFVAFGDSLYLFLGDPYDPPIGTGLKLSSAGGVVTSTRFDFAGSGNTFSTGAVGTYCNRMVYGNLGPGFEKNIVFSDPFLPAVIGNDALSANGRSFTVGEADGDRIVALVEVLQTGGTPAQSALLVLCEHSAHMITGEPNLTTDATSLFGSMEVVTMPMQCGCASAETVVKTPYGLIWASDEDVWMFSQGQLPRKIGTNISPALKNSPPTMRWRWHAAYFNKSYRLAVDSAGASPGENDPCGDQWWLDLRNGAPAGPEDAAWWGPQQYLAGLSTIGGICLGTLATLSDPRTGRPEALYLGVFAADTGGAIAQADVAKADDTVNYLGGLVPNPASYFTPETWTRVSDFDDPEIRKLYQGVTIGVRSSNPTGLQVEAQMDDGKVVDISTVSSPGQGFELGVSTLDGPALLTNEFNVLAIRPTSPATQRITGRRMQVRIREVQGLVIDDTNDKWVFSAPTYGSTPFVASLAHGIYATQDALLTAIAAAMNVAVANTVYVYDPSSPPAVVLWDEANQYLWFPVFVAITGSDPLVVEKSAALGQLAGFNPAVNPASADSFTPPVYNAAPPTAMLEFDEIAMKFSPIPRRVL